MKKIVVVLLALVMVLGLTACGGEDNEPKNDSVIELDGSTIEYIGSELGKDTEGKDAILLHYNYTNGADEPKSFFWTFFYTAKQGDTELEEAITWLDEDSFETHTDATFEDVEPGASKKVTISFNIIDKTTPVVVTFTDLMDDVLGETTVDPKNLRENSGGSLLGGNETSEEAGLVGYYVVNSMNMEGEELDYDMLSLMGFTENTYVVFRDDKTLDLAYGGEYLTFEYVDDGTFFNGFAAGTYEHEGDTVRITIAELGFDGTFIRSEGTPPEVPVYTGGFSDEVIEGFTGDWHGLAVFYANEGVYADEDGMTFEAVARFTFDEYGEVVPYILLYLNDGEEIEDIALYEQEGYIAMDVYGTLVGKELSGSEFFIDNYGALYFMLHADDGSGNVFNIQACLRKLDDEWNEENDYPYGGKSFTDFYGGKSLEEILEIYGIDPSVLPEMTEIPEGTGTAVSGEGMIDLATLEEGFIYYLTQHHPNNNYRKPSYEEIIEHMGGVEGKKDREDLWSDKLHIYRWDTPEGEWLMLNFNVDENGNEFCYGASWSTALKDEKETYGW